MHAGPGAASVGDGLNVAHVITDYVLYSTDHRYIDHQPPLLNHLLPLKVPHVTAMRLSVIWQCNVVKRGTYSGKVCLSVKLVSHA